MDKKHACEDGDEEEINECEVQLKEAKDHYRHLLKKTQERNIRLTSISCAYYPELPLQFPTIKIDDIIGFHGKHFLHRNLAEYDVISTVEGGNHEITVCK